MNHQVDRRAELDALIRDKCNIDTVRPFQLDHALDLINGQDVFLVIAPGMGKTTVLLAPLLAAQARNESCIAIIIVPTKLLGEQTARVASECGLRALAINEDTVLSAYYEGRNLVTELAEGNDVRVGAMSPQMAQSEQMIKFFGTEKIKMLLRYFLIDEAHLGDVTSGTWRVVYALLPTLRARLHSSTVWCAITGTATPRRALKIAESLGFQPGHYVNARYSVDRPNVKYITLFFKNAVSGSEFLDLTFIIPYGMTSVDDIPPTLVFCNTIEEGRRLMRFLDKLIPQSIPGRKHLIRLYNSVMPKDYRDACMRDFKDGSTLRVIICTDTCTYGLDLSCVRRGVNVGLPDSPEQLNQRLNRAGRDGKPAEVYMLVPSWMQIVPPEQIKTAQQKQDAARRAKLSPVLLQFFNPTPALCSRKAYLAYNEETCVPPPDLIQGH